MDENDDRLLRMCGILPSLPTPLKQDRRVIRSARLASGMKQCEVAQNLHINADTFHRFESGEQLLPAEIYARLTRLLKVQF